MEDESDKVVVEQNDVKADSKDDTPPAKRWMCGTLMMWIGADRMRQLQESKTEESQKSEQD